MGRTGAAGSQVDGRAGWKCEAHSTPMHVCRWEGVRALARHTRRHILANAPTSAAKPPPLGATTPATTPTHDGDWDAGLEPLHESDVLAGPLRECGGHNVG